MRRPRYAPPRLEQECELDLWGAGIPRSAGGTPALRLLRGHEYVGIAEVIEWPTTGE
jgi:hypothetical protein